MNIDWTESEHYWAFWTLTANSKQILNILNIDWKFWTDSEHYEHWLNRIWTLLNILNIDYKFWRDSEYSEHWLNRVWTFWTLTENSEKILYILSKHIMWYFTYLLLFLNQITTNIFFHFSLNLSFSLFQFFFLNRYILLPFH